MLQSVVLLGDVVASHGPRNLGLALMSDQASTNDTSGKIRVKLSFDINVSIFDVPPNLAFRILSKSDLNLIIETVIVVQSRYLVKSLLVMGNRVELPRGLYFGAKLTSLIAGATLEVSVHLGFDIRDIQHWMVDDP